jgi:PAS domain S-box-containing protein
LADLPIGADKGPAFFQNIVECAPDALIVVDRRQHICLVNAQTDKLFGYPRHELIGAHLDILIPDQFREHHGEHVHQFITAPHTRTMGTEQSLYARRKNGSSFPADIALSPLLKDDNLFVLAAVRDTTEKQLAEQQLQRYAAELERSNQDLESFALVAAHDLHAPMRRVQSICQLLRDCLMTDVDSEAKTFMNHMIQSVEHMQALIQGLLNHARIGRRESHFESFDSSEVLDEVLRNLEVPINESDACITRGALPTVLADRVQLARLLQNLINNAIVYRSERPLRIHIGAEERDGEWLFAVEDNGIGIEANHTEEIFAIFRRLHSEAERPGTGIGLASCKKIVELHGGRIWVESHVDEGSKFLFTIPQTLPRK